MKQWKMLASLFLCTAVGIALSLPGDTRAQNTPDAPIQIGMVKTFFNGVPDVLIKLVTEPFGDVMKASTGLAGKLVISEGTFDAAKRLDANEIQLGVFHGHEFAIAKKKYPKLTPLMVVVNDFNEVKAHVVVHKKSGAQKIVDLRGKVLEMPKMTKEHCRVFLNQRCTDNAQPNLNKFFAKVQEADSVYDGLDDVCRGKADAVIVDTIALEFYKSIKPAVFNNNLRILETSDHFPAPVIAYKQGTFNAATLKTIRDGLLRAHKNPAGKDLMKEWNIKAFEAVPENYTKQLADVLKAYPQPIVTTVSMR
ncbi:MAG: PhnD/SsuA/transferrin family substrate-binding protein [Planctomycetes bacterium]|nr:PhnD/SsuA/transferrin family substrate-binding protein [Planctomycetota bacterium]